MEMLVILLSIMIYMDKIYSFKDIVGCYSVYDNGLSYDGNKNIANTGETCLKWNAVNAVRSHYTRDHNYCRNPVPSEVRKPWCYTGRNFEYSECDIPACVDCYDSSNHGASYGGNINITQNGTPCTMWKDQPYFNTLDKNYCRNPDESTQPWCYINRERVKPYYGYCDIPLCRALCPVFRDPRLVYFKQYQAGETVDLQCKPGFKMRGNQHLTCLSNGQWNLNEPFCEAIKCPEPTLDSSVFQVIPLKIQYQYGEQITVSCLKGFIGESVTGICNDTWKWSPSDPICSQTLCPAFRDPNLVYLKQYKAGDSVNLKCKTGFKIRGNQHLTCRSNGQWNLNEPFCDAIKCPNPTLNISVFHVTPLKSQYEYTEQITVSCLQGFKGESVTGICKDTWTWSPSNLTCSQISCPNVTSVKYMEPFKALSYRHPENITFRCKKGYQLVGSSVLFCQANGEWNNRPPICIDTHSGVGYPVFGASIGAVALFILVTLTSIVIYLRKKTTANESHYEDGTANKGCNPQNKEDDYSELNDIRYSN